MKKILIGLLARGSISAFAGERLPVMNSYGEVNELLKLYNYDLEEDIVIGVSSIAEDAVSAIVQQCRSYLSDVVKSENNNINQIHAILIKQSIGASNGVCLIKANFNY